MHRLSYYEDELMVLSIFNFLVLSPLSRYLWYLTVTSKTHNIRNKKNIGQKYVFFYVFTINAFHFNLFHLPKFELSHYVLALVLHVFFSVLLATVSVLLLYISMLCFN